MYINYYDTEYYIEKYGIAVGGVRSVDATGTLTIFLNQLFFIMFNVVIDKQYILFCSFFPSIIISRI
jgi:hypothetical protein